jgi:uncharacterized protein (DUF58 family)
VRSLEPAAQDLAQVLPPLLLAARRVAATLMQGLHGRRRAGPGEDFWQFRPYAQGDSTARIDWRKSARSGRVLIREREWAAANTLWIWTASGPGMDWHSKLSPTPKSVRADLVTMAMAVLAAEAGERVGLLGSGLTPGHSRLTLSRIAAALEAPRVGQSLPPVSELPRFSTLLLAGDFLEPMEDITRRFTALAAHAAHAHVVEIVDPAEETLPWSGRVEFQEMNGAERLTFGHAQGLRQAYVQRRAEHRAKLRDLTRRLGFSHTLHRTDQPAATLMLTLHDLLRSEPGA